MTTATQKKLTVATVKSFIRKNRDLLLIETKSHFDGMQDMVTECEGGFGPVVARSYYDSETGREVEVSKDCKSTLGIRGVWFCGRDWVSRFETETVEGFEVSNCCGTWRVAKAK